MRKKMEVVALKSKGKSFVFALILCLALLSPAQALGAAKGAAEQQAMPPGVYLNLGDSIAKGRSAAPGADYHSLYGGYLLDAYGIVPLSPGNGFAVDGLKSGDLMDGLTYTTQAQLAVASASVITISIGGNNLLGPIQQRIGSLLPGPVDYTDPAAVKAAVAALALNPAFNPAGLPPEALWEVLVAGLTAEALDPASALGIALDAGKADFLEDWPAIVARIRELNPDAVVLALTLYNPVDPLEGILLFSRYEELVKPMNGALRKTQNQVLLADAYKAFGRDGDAVAFSLAWDTLNLDIHPTTQGHGILFEQLTVPSNLRDFRPLRLAIR
ncbi:GDSL-type esterase/lipase family protein [Anaerotalea alkaliphila]|uniref:SGNH hydrolase-type esterase domain-containing protein n=1 Tax=Anaerotalea alkaliphila TaxID=2662126 RepID=A0A7X5KLZ9_9FIRM|nr:GDSL-type esterase/lipase family protein [Anaerotalea alkaliphila]NDL67264.1 hypothetical protein [Anaerotalea alkaliphila]